MANASLVNANTGAALLSAGGQQLIPNLVPAGVPLAAFPGYGSTAVTIFGANGLPLSSTTPGTTGSGGAIQVVPGPGFGQYGLNQFNPQLDEMLIELKLIRMAVQAMALDHGAHPDTLFIVEEAV